MLLLCMDVIGLFRCDISSGTLCLWCRGRVGPGSERFQNGIDCRSVGSIVGGLLAVWWLYFIYILIIVGCFSTVVRSRCCGCWC